MQQHVIAEQGWITCLFRPGCGRFVNRHVTIRRFTSGNIVDNHGRSAERDMEVMSPDEHPGAAVDHDHERRRVERGNEA